MSERKTGTEHVVVERGTGHWRCQHCGERRQPPSGYLRLTVFLNRLQGFIMLHRDCRPEAEPEKEGGG